MKNRGLPLVSIPSVASESGCLWPLFGLSGTQGTVEQTLAARWSQPAMGHDVGAALRDSSPMVQYALYGLRIEWLPCGNGEGVRPKGAPAAHQRASMRL